MIQLTNVQRLLPRADVGLQSGYDQSMYRVLAIAQTNFGTLYTAAEVIRLGWNSSLQKEAYQDEYSVLYAWANKKNITATSQNRDKSGRPIKPAKWTGENWQSEVAHKLWNSAITIMNEALELQASNITAGRRDYRYWYDEEFGIIAVPEDMQSRMIAIANKKFFADKAQKSGSTPDTTWKDELTALLAPIQSVPESEHESQDDDLPLTEKENVPTAWRQKRWRPLALSAIALLILSVFAVHLIRPPRSPQNAEPSAQVASLPEELSISDAMILTMTTPESPTSKLPVSSWETYGESWQGEDRRIMPTGYSEYAPPLFLNCPVVLASLP